MKKIILSLTVAVLLSCAIFTALPTFVYAGSDAAQYLCDFGVNFYNAGRYEEALIEFKKVLLLEPNNSLAKDYINKIFLAEAKPVAPAVVPQRDERAAAIDTSFSACANQPSKPEEQCEEQCSEETKTKTAWEITGETQLSFGVTPDEFIWKLADFNLNEENWRLLSLDDYNNRENTYDPRVFDRLRVNIDSKNEEGFNLHANITIDPWSFVGKSDKITVTGGWGPPFDSAEIQYYYWSNTRYTFPNGIYTSSWGDLIGTGEIKVVDGKVPATALTSIFGNTYNVPEMEIHREYNFLRELWLDYKKDGHHFRFFPIAYQDQALTTDDPLRISNNHIYWDESPWLYTWDPGQYNSSPDDFTPGKWKRDFSFNTRDSDGMRLTALRGFSYTWQPSERTSFATTVASPKTLWQDYSSVDNIASANRLKHSFNDWFDVGLTYTFRIGLNEVDAGKQTDMTNHAMAADIAYEIVDGIKLNAEVANTLTDNNISNSEYRTDKQGQAYYFSLIGRFPRESIQDLASYEAVKQGKDESAFTKFKFWASRMDSDFDPMLSHYRDTRDDSYWSRHLHFKQPPEYFYAGLYYPSQTWDDIEPFRLGNGIDQGRDVLGFRVESMFFDRKLSNLFDVKNIHSTNGKNIENIVRDEIVAQPTEKLTIKALGLYQKMPRTHGGVDPFMVDDATGSYLLNSAIPDGADPSLKTGTIGAEYALFDWLAINGTYERTNDYTMAYDNFPRGVLVDYNFTTYEENGHTYRRDLLFLYDQGLFPLPPYPFYNIFKTGVKWRPADKLDIYLDWTRNEFQSAGQIDNNINHIGFEATYMPCKKFGMYLRYTYSQWNDLNLMLEGYDKYYMSHHNFFGELRYMPSDYDEIVLQYGEGGRSVIATVYSDPFGQGIPTLDTQHIFRAYYRRKF